MGGGRGGGGRGVGGVGGEGEEEAEEVHWVPLTVPPSQPLYHADVL